MMFLNYPDFLKNVPLDFEPARKFESHTQNVCIVSLGKSAFFMYDRFVLEYPGLKKVPAIIIVPFNSSVTKHGYNVETVFSTHPEITEFSFEAFKKLNDFIFKFRPDNIVVLLSGGSSALIEKSKDKEQIQTLNSKLLRSGLPITDINRERIKYSLIKGGKLAEMFPCIFWSVFVMSDIPYENGELLVGSMPFFRDDLKNTELFRVADSNTLHDEILKLIGNKNIFSLRKFNGSIRELSDIIIKNIQKGEDILVTGEPSIKIDTDDPGTGGRITHLALTVLPYLDSNCRFYALSSDGIDGNSPFAGAVIENPCCIPDSDKINRAILSFNSGNFLSDIGMTVKTGYTGINLNDFVFFTYKNRRNKKTAL